MTKCPKTGKHRFRTEDEANRQLKRIGRKQAIKSAKPIRSYFCMSCMGFHLTKMGIDNQSRPLKLVNLFTELMIKQQEHDE